MIPDNNEDSIYASQVIFALGGHLNMCCPNCMIFYHRYLQVFVNISKTHFLSPLETYRVDDKPLLYQVDQTVSANCF